MKILNMVFNMSITGSTMFFIFLFLKPITKKHFNSSWHYKMLILILTFFIIPANNFIILPINPISNISWMIGVIILLLLNLVPYIRFKSSILRDSTIVEEEDIVKLFNICKEELNLKTKVQLRTCNTVGSPMLIGIFRPVVLIPNIDKDYKRLKMIFLHELNHYKRNG